MPPKPKYSREEIAREAYELCREKGIDAVVARELAKRLNTSVSPIFTFYSSMDELKEDVKKIAKEEFAKRLGGVFESDRVFKEFGMRWISLAKEEPELYRFLFLNLDKSSNPYIQFSIEFEEFYNILINSIMNQFDLPLEATEALFKKMLAYGSGIAIYLLMDPELYTDEAISASLSEVCLALVLTAKLKTGRLDPDEADMYAKAVGLK